MNHCPGNRPWNGHRSETHDFSKHLSLLQAWLCNLRQTENLVRCSLDLKTEPDTVAAQMVVVDALGEAVRNRTRPLVLLSA